ncbi:hypothetical protein V7S43_015487 [Phytophthora oleae]|uniref:PiggyBac transposable element-derived protein domain-containing protein n=1 Tax=Phytophthora oleae TaxID=2107226 RepID=A0ABD3EYY7_9STRA
MDARDLDVFPESTPNGDAEDMFMDSGDALQVSENASHQSDIQSHDTLPADDVDMMDESWDIPIQGMPGTPLLIASILSVYVWVESAVSVLSSQRWNSSAHGGLPDTSPRTCCELLGLK